MACLRISYQEHVAILEDGHDSIHGPRVRVLIPPDNSRPYQLTILLWQLRDRDITCQFVWLAFTLEASSEGHTSVFPYLSSSPGRKMRGRPVLLRLTYVVHTFPSSSMNPGSFSFLSSHNVPWRSITDSVPAVYTVGSQERDDANRSKINDYCAVTMDQSTSQSIFYLVKCIYVLCDDRGLLACFIELALECWHDIVRSAQEILQAPHRVPWEGR